MAVDTARLERIRRQLDLPLARDEARTLETGTVPIFVRLRADRYYLDARGVSVAEARALGAPSDCCESPRRSSRRRGST